MQTKWSCWHFLFLLFFLNCVWEGIHSGRLNIAPVTVTRMSYKMVIRLVGLPRKGQLASILKMSDANPVVSIQKTYHSRTLPAWEQAALRVARWQFSGLVTPQLQPAFGLTSQPCPAQGVLIAGSGCPFVFMYSLSQCAFHYGLLAALKYWWFQQWLLS